MLGFVFCPTNETLSDERSTFWRSVKSGYAIAKYFVTSVNQKRLGTPSIRTALVFWSYVGFVRISSSVPVSPALRFPYRVAYVFCVSRTASAWALGILRQMSVFQVLSQAVSQYCLHCLQSLSRR